MNECIPPTNATAAITNLPTGWERRKERVILSNNIL